MLSIVSTPIGNLGDITLRAIEVLRTCDAIVCEDTRMTGQLLHHLNLPKKELISMHGYSDLAKIGAIIAELRSGRHLALVSDAGTPGISDPGTILVARETEAGIPIAVVPGASALLAALSGSGIDFHTFTYLGFLPIKKGRKTLLSTFPGEERTVVFFESVHRIERTLQELAEVLKDQPTRRIVIARELTKMHEEFVRTTAGELPQVVTTMTKKGEFVVVIEGSR